MNRTERAAEDLVSGLESRLSSLAYSAPELLQENLLRLSEVARAGVDKYRKAQDQDAAREVPPGERSLTRQDVLRWLAEWSPKEPSGADMVEFVSLVLDISDDVWIEVLETGKVPDGALPTDQPKGAA
jgi:hypothetical protein